MERANWFEELDYARAIAILSVMAIHVSANFKKISPPNLIATTFLSLDVFLHFAVPCFVFISGIVLYNKYSSQYSILDFYKRRFVTIIPPYIVFALVYIYLTSALTATRTDSPGLTPYDIIVCIFTGQNIGHLWFIVLILQLYVLYPLIERVYTFSAKRNAEYYLLLVILVIQVLYTLTIHKGILLQFTGYLFYFALGIYFCKRYKYSMEAIRDHCYPKLPIVLALILVAGIITSYSWMLSDFPNKMQYVIPFSNTLSLGIEPFFYSLCFIVVLFISTQLVQDTGSFSRYVRKIGQYSFGIYLVHDFFRLFLGNICFPSLNFNWNMWAYYPILFLTTLLLSYFFVELVSRIPYSQYIIGPVKK